MRNSERWRVMGRSRMGWQCAVVVAVGLVAGAARAQLGYSVERVSLSRDGGDPNDRSELPATSFDGSIVGFKSRASNLIEVDTNNRIDVFVRNRPAQTNERIPGRTAFEGEANGESYPPALDADGRYVAFGSAARNLILGDFNQFPDAFLYDRPLQRTANVSLLYDDNDEGRLGGRVPDFPPSLSYDGNLLVFVSDSPYFTDIDRNETEDVFVYNHAEDTVRLVSVTNLSAAGLRSANGPSSAGVISGDGRFVAFCSDASNLVVGAPSGVASIYRRDLIEGVTEHIAALPRGRCMQRELAPAIDADGSRIAFSSDPDNDGRYDVYLWDSGDVRQISNSLEDAPADGSSTFASISADGRFVAFQTTSSTMVVDDTNGVADVIVVDVESGEARRMSLTANGQQADRESGAPQISGDGTTVVFQSRAALVDDDGNNVLDIYASTNTLSFTPTPVTEEPTETPEPTPPVTVTATPTQNGPTRTPTTPSVGPTTPVRTATATASATNGSGGGTATPTVTATRRPKRSDDDGCQIAGGHSGGAAWWLLGFGAALAGVRRRSRVA